MNSVQLSPLSESLGQKQQEVRLTNPQCLVLSGQFTKTGLRPVSPLNLCATSKGAGGANDNNNNSCMSLVVDSVQNSFPSLFHLMLRCVPVREV